MALVASRSTTRKKGRKTATEAEWSARITVAQMLRSVYTPRYCPALRDRADQAAAARAGTKLVYGEVLPEGVSYMMDQDHLGAGKSRVLLDVGSGRGRLAMQCFAQFPNLRRVIGVELSSQHFSLCEAAVESFVEHCRGARKLVTCLRNFPSRYKNIIVTEYTSRRSPTASGSPASRSLEYYNSDVGKLKVLVSRAQPDIVTIDVAFKSIPKSLLEILEGLPSGCRILTYEDIFEKWPKRRVFPFKETHCNDRYKTSWNSSVGHSFFSWIRCCSQTVQSRGDAKRLTRAKNRTSGGSSHRREPCVSVTAEKSAIDRPDSVANVQNGDASDPEPLNVDTTSSSCSSSLCSRSSSDSKPTIAIRRISTSPTSTLNPPSLPPQHTTHRVACSSFLPPLRRAPHRDSPCARRSGTRTMTRSRFRFCS